jgi:hypothetical protein
MRLEENLIGLSLVLLLVVLVLMEEGTSKSLFHCPNELALPSLFFLQRTKAPSSKERKEGRNKAKALKQLISIDQPAFF